MERKDFCDLSEELQQKMTNKAGKEFKEKGEVSKDAIKRFLDEEITDEYTCSMKSWQRRIFRK